MSETKVRVRYAETDQAGMVYHGNYAAYFEVGRVEAIRQMGLSYKIIEERGFIMPVLFLSSKYLKPAYYDDLLTIRTYIYEMPGVRMKFDYEVFNEAAMKLTIGQTIHAFVRLSNRKPAPPPDWFLELMARHI